MIDLGTILFTWLFGELIGTDEFETRYYRSKTRKRWGREQRWCLFRDDKDPSKIPAEWHAWLHHCVDEPLIAEAVSQKFWAKPHQLNLTGTAGAYRPAGHYYQGGHRAGATGDYQPWTPE